MEYEAIKCKEAETKDKNVSRRLQVLMLRYEGKKVREIAETLNLHKVSITQMCQRYQEQGLEEYARNKYESHYRLLSKDQETEILARFSTETGKRETAKEIKAALDEACGRDTGAAYVYNVLKRHGWKKVLHSRRPKDMNEEACEASKNTRVVYWNPCPQTNDSIDV